MPSAADAQIERVGGCFKPAAVIRQTLFPRNPSDPSTNLLTIKLSRIFCTLFSGMRAASLIFWHPLGILRGLPTARVPRHETEGEFCHQHASLIQKAFTGSPKLTYPYACSLITSCRTL